MTILIPPPPEAVDYLANGPARKPTPSKGEESCGLWGEIFVALADVRRH